MSEDSSDPEDRTVPFLPPEIWEEIAYKTGSAGILALSRTNKAFSHYSINPDGLIWRYLLDRDFPDVEYIRTDRFESPRNLKELYEMFKNTEYWFNLLFHTHHKDLRYAQLENIMSDLMWKTIEDVDLSFSTIRDVSFYGSTFVNVSFESAKLESMLFGNCDMYDCDFLGASIDDVRFNEFGIAMCGFEYSTIANINFYRGSIAECSFDYATIEKSSFPGLNGCGLSCTTFHMANIDDETRFNGGFTRDEVLGKSQMIINKRSSIL